jgi:hypothetical protein
LRGLINLKILNLGHLSEKSYELDELNESLRGLRKLQIISFGRDSYKVVFNIHRTYLFELEKMKYYYQWDIN